MNVFSQLTAPLSEIFAKQYQRAAAEMKRKAIIEDEGIKVFRSNLRRIRLLKGMTQEQLSIKADLTSTAVAQYECGARVPGLKNIMSLREALGCSMDDLMMKDESAEGQYERGFQDGLKASIKKLEEM